jgi:hypothetical protein
MRLPTITINLIVLENTVHYQLHFSKQLRKYFLQDKVFVRYDNKIDLQTVPNSILTIPIVSIVAPIAWAVGADLLVPELETTYMESLNKTKEIFRGHNYPFAFTSDVKAERSVTSNFHGERTCLFFSNGIDSLSSYLKNKEKKPDLVTIWGVPDIPLSERRYWNSFYNDISRLAEKDGITALKVETDIFRSLNTELLQKQFGINWYTRVSNGLAFPGLCAPIIIARHIGVILRAASTTQELDDSVGEQIDSSQSWGGIKVTHDGYDMSRQQKVKFLCLKNNREYLSHLKVCNETTDPQHINCRKCEKCMRTTVALLLEGVNPQDCNLDMNKRTVPYIINCFNKGKIPMNKPLIWVWKDLQKYVPLTMEQNIIDGQLLIDWLNSFDFIKYKSNSFRHYIWKLYLLSLGGRLKFPYLLRKVRCYYYMILSDLRYYK